MDSSVSINTSSTANPVDMYGIMNSFAINPVVLGIVFAILLVYILFFSSVGSSMSSTFSSSSSSSGNSIFSRFGTNGSSGSSSSNNMSGTKIFLFIIFIILCSLAIVKALQYFFSINVTANLANLFTPKPQLDITVDQTGYKTTPVPVQRIKEQVFNVPGNTYGYNDAKAVCKAYGSRLATYKEVEETYNKGGEWCNYGWSDGQMALFPTQQKTFDHLQTIPGHEHDCGRPGINGGYIANPNVKFGVNCFGHKPLITQQESDLMKTQPPYPITEKDIAFQQRVDYWKTKLGDILVSPFNHRLWSQII